MDHWIVFRILYSDGRVIHVSEQRKNLRDLSRGGFVRRPPDHNRSKKKHKPNKQSTRAAAQEFLEKAARELLGACEPGLKGPLQVISDQEDD